MLGKVNPLALEEFSALEERHKFLTEQLEDLKKTRKDLLDIVREVDERVEQVFTEAYADVERLRPGVFRAAVPRRRGPAGPHRPRRHAHHRHRGRGPPARQEGQAALAALRWRAVAGRGGLPGRAVQGPAVAVLHPRRGRGGARRHQPRPAAGDLRGAARELPAARHHPPEADDGGRRRALRRHDARRRRLGRDQPAAARTARCADGSRPTASSRDPTGVRMRSARAAAAWSDTASSVS
jgi:chromosome segregation protein